MYTLVVKNGKIIDGSGGEPYYADVAIENGKIVKIGENIDSAERVIDAEGLVVAPGFIDSHSHADNAVFTFPDMKEKIEQGITTAIAGQCGTSPAPLPVYYDKESETLIEGYGREYDIQKTMGSFIECASKVPQGCNIAMFVGHSAVRKAVMGMDNREPTSDELERMKELVREAMRSGAYGMSIGLYYSPGSFSKPEEIIELAKVVREEGGVLSSHIRTESDRVLEAGSEFLDIVKASGVRGVHSHIKSCGEQNFGKVATLLESIDRANGEGADVYCDVYPYAASHTSLGATFVPKQFHAGGKTVESMKDPEKRKIAKEYTISCFGENDLSWVLVASAKNRPDAIGKRIPDIARERGTDVYDTVFDIIVDSGNRASACYFRMNEGDVETAIKHPRSMICTDAGVSKGAEVYHPRLRGSFPRAIARYTREKAIISLPEMIRKMTSLPAKVYGLSGKGLIAEGYDADICIFSEQKLTDRADYGNCTPGCEGLNYVIVSGVTVVENAVHNGKRCAKVLRKNHV